MSKYKSLENFLSQSGESEIEMTFEEVEKIIGFNLPPSAYTYSSYWSNNVDSCDIKVAWLSAGYISEKIDMSKRTLVFRKSPVGNDCLPFDGGAWNRLNAKNFNNLGESSYFDSVRGSFKDVITIPKGIDLTQPTDSGWEPLEEK